MTLEVPRQRTGPAQVLSRGIMSVSKHLFAGTAASVLIVSGAVAADLPVKTSAAEYVRICSGYGEGFFYIPGTDTCIKLGGYARVDSTLNGLAYDQPAYSGGLGQGNRFADRINSRSRVGLTTHPPRSGMGSVPDFGRVA